MYPRSHFRLLRHKALNYLGYRSPEILVLLYQKQVIDRVNMARATAGQ